LVCRRIAGLITKQLGLKGLRALSIENVSNHQNLSPEMQIARLELMLEISRSLNSTLNLRELLHSIMEVATQLTDTEAAGVLLLDKNTGELYFEAATGDREEEIGRISVPLEGSIAGWVAQHGEVLVIDNAQEDERHFGAIDSHTDFVTQNILGVPLKVHQKTIGVLEVVNKRQNSSFTNNDIDILNTLAAQAAVAIENARLFRQNDELANVVHELRSPMASIIGYSQLMLMQPDMPKDRLTKGLENIYQEATRLSQIINDFLDLAKLETGRVSMRREPVVLQELIEEVIEQLYPQAQEKEIRCNLDIKGVVPELKGDRNRIKQVLVNLLDTAIKYNRPGGKVELTLTCNAVRVLLSVGNTGQGIAPDKLDYVFDKFYRVDEEQHDVRGTGLGLAIAKSIVEAHNGEIWVESELGVGSKFTFSLPFEDH